MRSGVHTFWLGLFAIFALGCKREQRVFDPGTAGTQSGGRRFLEIRACRRRRFPLPEMSEFEDKCLRRRRRQAAVQRLQLRRMPCAGRRCHRTCSDGLRMDLRKSSRSNLFDHRAGPSKRHA